MNFDQASQLFITGDFNMDAKAQPHHFQREAVLNKICAGVNAVGAALHFDDDCAYLMMPYL